MYEFWLKLKFVSRGLIKNLFQHQLGAGQATSHYLNQWWPSSLTHICINRHHRALTHVVSQNIGSLELVYDLCISSGKQGWSPVYDHRDDSETNADLMAGCGSHANSARFWTGNLMSFNSFTIEKRQCESLSVDFNKYLAQQRLLGRWWWWSSYCSWLWW